MFNERTKSGWLSITVITTALTLPFVFIMKNMASSLQTIAEKIKVLTKKLQ